MAKVIILRGVPGSGKSSWVKDYCEGKDDEFIGILSRDNIRASLFGTAAAHGVDEDEVTNRFNYWYKEYLIIAQKQDVTIIIDNTNCDWSRVEELDQVAWQFGIPTETIVIDTDLEEALRRNAARDRVVPEHVIRRMYDQLQETKDFTL